MERYPVLCHLLSVATSYSLLIPVIAFYLKANTPPLKRVKDAIASSDITKAPIVS